MERMPERFEEDVKKKKKTNNGCVEAAAICSKRHWEIMITYWQWIPFVFQNGFRKHFKTMTPKD